MKKVLLIVIEIVNILMHNIDNDKIQVITKDNKKGYIEREEGDKALIYLYEDDASYMMYREEFDTIN